MTTKPKCRECGKRLSAYTEARRLPRGRVLELKTTRYGHEGNGYFCSLRCGYQFAVTFCQEQE